MTKSTAKSGVGALLLFGLFWNGLIGVFDVVILRQKLAEWHARSSFVEVEARVVSSSVESSTDSEGSTTYGPEVTYAYEIDGGRYTSDRYAYSSWGTSDSGFAYDVVAEYPSGADVVALVDPTDPREAVLDASGDAFPALVLVFLTPFHCVGLGIVAYVVRAFRRRRWTEEDRVRHDYVFIDDEDRFVLRSPPTPGLYVFLGALGILSFVAIFVMAFTLGMMGSNGYAGPVWLALVGAAGWIMHGRRKADRSPENFLHVDRRLRLFSYPADALGESLDDIEGLRVRSEPTGTTVNDVPVVEHVFEATIEGRPMRVFRHKGSPDDADVVLPLLEEALSLAPSAGHSPSRAA